MSKRVQFIRHTTADADAFLGLTGEITVDKEAKALRVHDSLTEGGIKVARADLANVANATSTVAGKMSATDKVKLDFIYAPEAIDLEAIKTKVDFISISGAANIDQMRTDIALNEIELDELGVQDTKLNSKTFPLGLWDMQGTASVTITHGLTLNKIRSVSAGVYPDDESEFIDFGGTSSSYLKCNASNILLSRLASGDFDDAAFNNGSLANRGFVVIEYTD
jgi:hypothetical protein